MNKLVFMNRLALIIGTIIICQVTFTGTFVRCETSSELIGETEESGEARSLIANEISNKEYTMAVKKLIDYIAQDPGGKYLDEAYFYLGRCYEYENYKINPNKWFDAIQSYQNVIEKYPESTYLSRSEFNIGSIYLNGGEYDQAIPYLKKASTNNNLGRLKIKSLFYLAKSYQAKGEDDQAKRIYTQIINDYPDSHWSQRSQEELGYLASTMPEDRKHFQPLYLLKRVVSTHRTGVSFQSELKLGWEAVPAYSNDKLIPENLTSVEVTFTIEESYARWTSRLMMDGIRDSGEQEYEIRWDKGPGPFLITIDKETGKPSQNEITGEATVIIKYGKRNIVGKSDSKTFIFSDYLKTLRSE